MEVQLSLVHGPRRRPQRCIAGPDRRCGAGLRTCPVAGGVPCLERREPHRQRLRHRRGARLRARRPAGVHRVARGLPLHARALRLDVPVEAVDHAACSRGSAPPIDTNGASTSCSRRAATASRPPSTCPRSWAATPTTRSPRARSGSAASPSTPWPTCEDLYRGIDLGAVTTSMTINSPAAILLAMYVGHGRGSTASPRAALGGTLQNDILKEYQAQKEFVFPPRPSLRLVARHDHVLRGRDAPLAPASRSPATTSARPARRPSQELAFTVANGFAYVELALAAGLAIDTFAPRLSFFFNAHIDFFEEIAKYRAARRIWARWLRERYGATDERSLQLRFHTQTAGVSLTAQQPEVNIVRTAIEALAGVLGGTQSLHTNSMDETLALPTEKAARIALRTQQVIAHETRRRQRRRPARRLVVRRGAHRRDGAARRGDLRPHRRARLGLDARRRAARHRRGLVPGRDRRLGLRPRAQAATTAGTWSSASTPSPRATTSRRPSCCASPPSRSSSR